MTHVPCPPVKIPPAVFQRGSIINGAANKNNGACGAETRQGEREKSCLGQKYLEVLFTYSSSFCFPSRLRVRPRTCLDIFGKSSHGFSVAIQTGNLPALSAGTLSRRGGPSKDASLQGPTMCGWITGHNSVIPYYEGKAARPLCLLPNWECQTFY